VYASEVGAEEKKTRREGTLHCQKERAAQQDVETEDDEKRIQDNYGQDEQKRQAPDRSKRFSDAVGDCDER
jgi:hypothetical protein